jgi:hypothetical protein
MVKIITPIYHSATCAVKAKSPILQYPSPIGRKPGGGRQQPAVPHTQPLRIPKNNLSRFYWRKMLRRARMEGIPDQA